MKHKNAPLLDMTICFLLIMACSPLSMLATPTAIPTETASPAPTLAPTSTETLTPSPPTVTPVPTSARPIAPKNLKVTYDCQWSKKGHNLVQITIFFTWEDVSDNETGFDIYKNGTFMKQLPANTTRYVDPVVIGSGNPSGDGAIYAIQAFNAVGKSNRVSISMRYQC